VNRRIWKLATKIRFANSLRRIAARRRGQTRVGNRGNFLAYSHIGTIAPWAIHVIFPTTAVGRPRAGGRHHAMMGGLTAVHHVCRIGRFRSRRLFQNRAGRSTVHDPDGIRPKFRGVNLVAWSVEFSPKREADQGSPSPDLSFELQHASGCRSDAEGSTAKQKRSPKSSNSSNKASAESFGEILTADCPDETDLKYLGLSPGGHPPKDNRIDRIYLD